MLESKFVKAVDVEDVTAYQPKVRPGYTAWVNLFPTFDRKKMMLSFQEIRKEPNSGFQPCPLDFFEAMGLPIKVGEDLMGRSTPDFVFEYPVLVSDETGNNWQEIGRSTVFDRHFWICALPDGSLLRAHGVNAYRYDLGKDRRRTIISKSCDGGTTWQELSTIVEDVFFYAQRLRRLKDGTLIVLGGLNPSFGPEGNVSQRGIQPVNAMTRAVGVFFLSHDQGKSWSPPQTICPGEVCWEPDFVELPSGDLLFVNSTSQTSRNTRQYYRKRDTGHYVPGPVLAIEAEPHFIVPETIVMTDDGLIVGARRSQGVPGSGTYTCSNDEGATWHVIGGLPRCLYQPMIQQLADGRIICASHVGGDSRYGEHDMNITVHVFRLEANLPRATRLVLSRDKNAGKTQYVNAYTATLLADEQPVANREVEFRVLEGASREDHRDIRQPQDVETRGDVFKAVTDAQGRAHVALPEYDTIISMHINYMVQAFFVPGEEEENLLPCRSMVYRAYAMTPEAGKANNYALYLGSGGVLWVEDELLDAYPEIEQMVEHFSSQGIEVLVKNEIVEKIGISQERASEVIEILRRWNVLLDREDGQYQWNPVRKWASPNNPVLIREVRRICLADHFVL